VSLAAYLALEQKVRALDDEAEKLRDKMDPLWHALADDERELLNALTDDEREAYSKHMNIPDPGTPVIFNPQAPPPQPPAEPELPPPPVFKPQPVAEGVTHINTRTFFDNTPEEGQPHLEDLFQATPETPPTAPAAPAPAEAKPPMTLTQMAVDFLQRWLVAVEKNADAQERIAAALEDVSSRMRDEMERKMSHFGAKD
jgi:hypothetical protein